ncbi:MAG: cytochrome c oxidase assembly protein [Actinobacteria bacterium]|nr:cytochrome c oxidase assembly protein [Actinomycetota bacterium]
MDPHSWSLHWEVLLTIGVLAAAYFWSQRRCPAGSTRRVAFDVAVILLLAVYITPLHTIALHYLLSAHLLQNVVTAEWAPGLVVFALAPPLAQHLERFRAVRLLTHPLVALPLWLGTYFVWHVPPIYDAALEQSGWLLDLEHLTYFLAGVLMWWPVVQGRYSDGVKALYLFAAFVLAAPLGLLLALLPRPIYDFYRTAPQLWGLSDRTDQEIAGVTMAVEQALVFFAVFAYFMLRFLRTEHIAGVFSESSR